MNNFGVKETLRVLGLGSSKGSYKTPPFFQVGGLLNRAYTAKFEKQTNGIIIGRQDGTR